MTDFRENPNWSQVAADEHIARWNIATEEGRFRPGDVYIPTDPFEYVSEKGFEALRQFVAEKIRTEYSLTFLEEADRQSGPGKITAVVGRRNYIEGLYNDGLLNNGQLEEISG